MRLLVVLLVCSIICGSASAKTLTPIHPGLMCMDASALAKLTLPDGSSRTTQPHPLPSDIAIKQRGGCIDLHQGLQLEAISIRKRTSLVSYKGKTFVTPNIDFQGATATAVCLDYDPASVRLTGKIVSKPAFDPDGNPQGTFEALQLTEPICTKANPAQYEDAKSNQNLLELVFLNGFPAVPPPENTEITVTGKLFPADNGNQQTPVLIEVGTITPNG